MKDISRTMFRHFGNVIVTWVLFLIVTSSQQGPGRFSDLGDDLDSLHPLSEVFPGHSHNPSQTKQELNQEKRTIALKDMSRLFEFVTVQEEISPHSNFYCRHMMVQQFLQIQLKTNLRATRRNCSMSIARLFGKKQGMAQNIVRWEKSWVEEREILKQKN